VLKLIGIFSVV